MNKLLSCLFVLSFCFLPAVAQSSQEVKDKLNQEHFQELTKGLTRVHPTEIKVQPKLARRLLMEKKEGWVVFGFDVDKSGKFEPRKFKVLGGSSKDMTRLLSSRFTWSLDKMTFANDKGQKNAYLYYEYSPNSKGNVITSRPIDTEKANKITKTAINQKDLSVDALTAGKVRKDLSVDALTAAKVQKDKGPYGNTAETFGYGSVSMGMKLQIKEKIWTTVQGKPRKQLELNLFDKVHRSGYARSIGGHCKIVKGAEETREYFKTIDKLKSYGLGGTFREREKSIWNEMPITFTWFSDIRVNGVEYQIWVVDKTVVGIVVSKKYINSGKSSEDFIGAVKQALGKAKRQQSSWLFYEGDRTNLPVREHWKLLRNYPIEQGKFNPTPHMSVWAGGPENQKTVLYQAHLNQLIFNEVQKNNKLCFENKFNLARKMLKEAEASDTGIEL